MSKKKRRRHSAKFKAKVALEAVKEIKTASEIGAEYEVHPAQISDWKRQLLGNLDSAFEKGSQSKDQEDFTEERDKLRAKLELHRPTIAPNVPQKSQGQLLGV